MNTHRCYVPSSRVNASLAVAGVRAGVSGAQSGALHPGRPRQDWKQSQPVIRVVRGFRRVQTP